MAAMTGAVGEQISPLQSSADGAQDPAQFFRIVVAEQPVDFIVGASPDGNGAGEDGAAFLSELEDAAAPVGGVGRDFDKAAALKRFEGGCQSGPVHGEQLGDRSHGRRCGAV